MAKTYNEVKEVIATITNEVEDGANTGNRIGSAMNDIVDYAKEVTDIQSEETDKKVSELEASTEQKLKDLVVQETGDGENVVMSQKAVTEKIGEVKAKAEELELADSILREEILKDLSEDGNVKVAPLITDGLIVQDTIQSYSVYSLFYVHVTEGTEYMLQFTKIDDEKDGWTKAGIGFVKDIPSLNAEVFGYQTVNTSYWTDNSLTPPTFVAPFDGYLCFSYDTRKITIQDFIYSYIYKGFAYNTKRAIDIIRDELEYNMASQDVNISNILINGLIGNNDSITEWSVYDLYYIPVNKNKTYYLKITYTGTGKVLWGYTQDVPSNGVAISNTGSANIDYWATPSLGIGEPPIFNASLDGYLCISIDTRKIAISEIKFFAINDGLNARITNIDGGIERISDKITNPSKLYELDYTNGINFFNRIYIEGLVNGNYPKLKLNGKQSVIVSKPEVSWYADMNVPVIMSGIGKEEILNVPVYRSFRAWAKNNTFRIMCIGDSLTDGGYPSIAEAIFKNINDEIGDVNVTMVGNRVDENEISFPIGNTYKCRGCNVGKAGHSLASYLRHFMLVRPSGNSSDYIGGKAAWDSLGLGTMSRNGVATRSYVEWMDNAENRILLAKTCHGWYDADPSKELWSWLKETIGMTSFVYNGITYNFSSSYTTEDDATQIAAIKYLCNNVPWNGEPFYDYEVVQRTNGNYAFSLYRYIERYKTLANDGITRLIAGDTAGSNVDNVYAWDVCVPTHVVIIMTTNDGWTFYGERGDLVAEDMQLISTIIRSEYPSMNILCGSPRKYGAFNPHEYSNIGFPNQYVVDNYFLSAYEAMRDQQDRAYDMLNLYQSQGVMGIQRKVVDILDNRLSGYTIDDTHTDFMLYLDRAYQVVAWAISAYQP